MFIIKKHSLYCSYSTHTKHTFSLFTSITLSHLFYHFITCCLHTHTNIKWATSFHRTAFIFVSFSSAMANAEKKIQPNKRRNICILDVISKKGYRCENNTYWSFVRTTKQPNKKKHNIHKMKINVDGACSPNITISRIKWCFMITITNKKWGKITTITYLQVAVFNFCLIIVVVVLFLL